MKAFEKIIIIPNVARKKPCLGSIGTQLGGLGVRLMRRYVLRLPSVKLSLNFLNTNWKFVFGNCGGPFEMSRRAAYMYGPRVAEHCCLIYANKVQEVIAYADLLVLSTGDGLRESIRTSRSFENFDHFVVKNQASESHCQPHECHCLIETRGGNCLNLPVTCYACNTDEYALNQPNNYR